MKKHGDNENFIKSREATLKSTNGFLTPRNILTNKQGLIRAWREKGIVSKEYQGVFWKNLK
jgi:hypothetical protein